MRRRAAAWVLALGLGLLLAQSIGLLHRTAHGGVVARVTAPAGPAQVQGSAPAGGWFDGHDDGSAECRLVDQLTHADALLPTVWVPALLAPAVLVGRWVRTVPALRPLAAYRARGPPAG